MSLFMSDHISYTYCNVVVLTQRAHKPLVNVYITFTITFRIDLESPFIERLVLVKTFYQPLLNVT